MGGKKTWNFLLFFSFHGKILFFLWGAALKPQKTSGIIPEILILFKIPVGKGDLGKRVGILVLFLPLCAFPVKFPKEFPPHAQEKLFGVIFFWDGEGGKERRN